MALSSVIGMPIQFIWPSVIKPAEAGLAGDPRFRFSPRLSSDDEKVIYIMLTTTHSPQKGKMWNMNHFCAVSRKTIKSKICTSVDLDESEDEFQVPQQKRIAASKPLFNESPIVKKKKKEMSKDEWRPLRDRINFENEVQTNSPKASKHPQELTHSLKTRKFNEDEKENDESGNLSECRRLQTHFEDNSGENEMQKAELKTPPTACSLWLTSKQVLEHAEQKVPTARLPNKPLENCVRTLSFVGKAFLLE